MAGKCGTEGHGHSDHRALSQLAGVMLLLTLLPDLSSPLQAAHPLPRMVDMENSTPVCGYESVSEKSAL